jgi:hypothetical protein
MFQSNMLKTVNKPHHLSVNTCTAKEPRQNLSPYSPVDSKEPYDSKV